MRKRTRAEKRSDTKLKNKNHSVLVLEVFGKVLDVLGIEDTEFDVLLGDMPGENAGFYVHPTTGMATVMVNNKALVSKKQLASSIIHEITHYKQMLKFPNNDAFKAAYEMEEKIKGYDNNKYEVEARFASSIYINQVMAA